MKASSTIKLPIELIEKLVKEYVKDNHPNLLNLTIEFKTGTHTVGFGYGETDVTEFTGVSVTGDIEI